MPSTRLFAEQKFQIQQWQREAAVKVQVYFSSINSKSMEVLSHGFWFRLQELSLLPFVQSPSNGRTRLESGGEGDD